MYPDNSIKLWDVKNGKLLKTVDNVAERAIKIFFVCNDSIILVHFHYKLVAMKETGEILYTISLSRERTLFCPAEKGRVVFLVFQDNTIEWYDAKNGRKIDTTKCPDGIQFSETGYAVGKSKIYIVGQRGLLNTLLCCDIAGKKLNDLNCYILF